MTRQVHMAPYWDVGEDLVRKTQVAGRLLREIASTVVPGEERPPGWSWPVSEVIAVAYAGTDQPDGELAELIMELVDEHVLPGSSVPEALVEPIEPLFVQPGPRRLR